MPQCTQTLPQIPCCLVSTNALPSIMGEENTKEPLANMALQPCLCKLISVLNTMAKEIRRNCEEYQAVPSDHPSTTLTTMVTSWPRPTGPDIQTILNILLRISSYWYTEIKGYKCHPNYPLHLNYLSRPFAGNSTLQYSNDLPLKFQWSVSMES